MCINRQTSIGDLIKLSFVAAENGDMMYNGQLPQPKTTTTRAAVVVVTTMTMATTHCPWDGNEWGAPQKYESIWDAH